MWYFIGLVVAVVIFGVGFFVGKKNGQRFVSAAKSLKDTIGKS